MGLPLGKVKIEWSPNFAYAIGLLVTDGSLSIDGRHINFTSSELPLIQIFKKCLGLTNKIGKKLSGLSKTRNYFQVQFGDIQFYRFLLSIGLMPNKTKIIKAVKIPDKYFFDFLRGHLDGDGSFYSYWDPRWKSSYMFYTTFCSASRHHVDWLREEIFRLLNIKGHINRDGKRVIHQLKYAKSESRRLLEKIYYSDTMICLPRKRLKIQKALSIIS